MKNQPMPSTEIKDKPKEGFNRPILLIILIVVVGFGIGAIAAKMI